MENQETLRVAHVIGKMLAGGVEAVAFNYYRAIDRDKIQFDFFYDEDSTVEPLRELIEMGARFYKMPPYQKIWRYLPTLRKHLKENQYKIVHSHLNALSVFPLFAAWSAGVPVRIAHSHSVPGGSEWKRNLLKNFLKHFSKVFATDYFACSEKAGRWLFGDACFERGNVTVINNAIDFSRFQIGAEQRAHLKEKLQIGGRRVVGHVGRFTFAKNHEKLLNIFAYLHKMDANTVLLLVGDGELKPQIEKQIEQLKLEDSVIMVGKVTDPENYYSIMDVAVIPSIFEGFSLTAIEAQISGVPVVISKVIPDEAVISDGFKYVNVDQDDSIWADAVQSLIGKSVNLDARKDRYDITICAGELQRWYSEHS